MNRKDSVGKLEIIPIRELFKHEAHDFSRWLADNIDALSERIGINLIVEGREMPAGSFRADIVCKDAQGNGVIVENQLERSDHEHLGKLMTYMAHFNANTAIWVTPEPRPEHQTTIENLNSRNIPGFAFYLVKVEAIRIDNSRPTALFTVLLRPDEGVMPVEKTKADLPLMELKPETEAPKATFPTVWCIYPRRDEQTLHFFLNENLIGFGLGNLGNLSKVGSSPEAFKTAWAKSHPNLSAAQIRAFYPMSYSFVHRAAIGDMIVYPPTWFEKKIYIGRITGNYQYKRWQAQGYNDLRPVRWINEVPRDRFSQEALRGIGVNLAFFQVHNEMFLSELKQILA